MDEITPNATNHRNTVRQPVGCSTVLVNQPDCVRINQSNDNIFQMLFAARIQFFSFYFRTQEVIAHTEDALIEVLNHYYIVSAHIIEPVPQGKYKVCFGFVQSVRLELIFYLELRLGYRRKIHFGLLCWSFAWI